MFWHKPKDGKLFVISGHSGAGKTTIIRSIMENEVVSFTTRTPRTGEVDGKDYNFITLQEFESLKENNRLVEYAQYANNYYGLTNDAIVTKLNGRDAFVIVDVVGYRRLQELIPPERMTSIFIWTEWGDAIAHMRKRGDSEDTIRTRLTLGQWAKEKSHSSGYDYVIKNKHNELSKSISIVRAIIKSEKIC